MEILVRIIASLAVTVLCAAPIWLYLVAKAVFMPEGFWQQLVLAGVGLYVLGGFQFSLFIVWLIALYYVWAEA